MEHREDHGEQRDGQQDRQSRSKEMEDLFEDQLRSFPVKLPLLPDPATTLASLEAGDWLTQIRPLVGDGSARAGSWWDGVLERVTTVYLQWLEASHIERLKIGAPKTVQDQSERLAQRVTTMLLEVLPQGLRRELIATRKLEVNEILFHIHKVYQPGGVAERQQMLASITNTKEAQDAHTAVEALPDGLLRIQALDRVMGGLLKKDAQASFRISTFRLQGVRRAMKKETKEQAKEKEASRHRHRQMQVEISLVAIRRQENSQRERGSHHRKLRLW